MLSRDNRLVLITCRWALAAVYIAEQEAGFGFADLILPIVHATRTAPARFVE